MDLSQERLKELLSYDLDSGMFTWLADGNNQFMIKGAEAGCISDGYRRIRIDRVSYKAHRLAILYVTGSLPIGVDHDDHNGLNNSFDNLREADQGENMKNKAMHSNNTTGITGVNWHKQLNKWQACISNNKKRIHLGLHTDINAAILTRKVAEFAYGFHPNHGKLTGRVCNG